MHFITYKTHEFFQFAKILSVIFDEIPFVEINENGMFLDYCNSLGTIQCRMNINKNAFAIFDGTDKCFINVELLSKIITSNKYDEIIFNSVNNKYIIKGVRNNIITTFEIMQNYLPGTKLKNCQDINYDYKININTHVLRNDMLLHKNISNNIIITCCSDHMCICSDNNEYKVETEFINSRDSQITQLTNNKVQLKIYIPDILSFIGKIPSEFVELCLSTTSSLISFNINIESFGLIGIDITAYKVTEKN